MVGLLHNSWVVTGSVENALSVKGIRARLYKISSSRLGYYDGEGPAFYYSGKERTLYLRIVFETKENALYFENDVQNEHLTQNSPFNTSQCKISTKVSEYSSNALGKRIFYHHYDPDETSSPQDIMSQISGATSVLDQSRPVFMYQRLERESVFGAHYKADSCHLISASVCRNNPAEYGMYNDDENNRLALSKDVHAWFDGHQVDVPLFDLKVELCSRSPVLDGRYQVDLLITAFDLDAARMLFHRLKEGSVEISQLVYRTFVYVLDKETFCKCVEWKSNEIQTEWRKVNNMQNREW